MRMRAGIFICVLCLFVITMLSGSCRRNQPSLIDANKPPNTELWYAPPESTDYEYRVHLFWRGVDNDGTVMRYIWTKTDTIAAGELAWNPAERLRDFRSGRITAKTDSIFSFTAFRSTGGVGLKKNRQAFHVAAIDDNGVIDPSPARVEFIATIDELPEIRFRVWRQEILPTCDTPSGIERVWREIRYNVDNPPTVGMFRPFRIVYEGFTPNGRLIAYKWFPLSTTIEMEGAGEWTTDLGDTIRDFPNIGDLALPSGPFLFAAQCKDEADAESTVDAGKFTEGVCRVIVNFDPETEIFEVLNTYIIDGSPVQETVDFKDDVPDTLPYGSWVTLLYRGSNDTIATLQCPDVRDISIPRDSSLCEDDTNMCIKYQTSFYRASERFSFAEARTSWMPQNGEDTNPYGTSDSTSMNVGSVEYKAFVRSIDEYGKFDGTPSEFDFVGNHDPVLDSLYIMDHLGNKIYDGDTLTWNWWDVDSVFIINPPPMRYEKKFNFSVNAFGHDHPKEFGSGVKSWIYLFYDMQGTFNRFARAGNWVHGQTPVSLSDSFKVTFVYYPPDFFGDSIFVSLPRWANKTYDLTLKGRDLEIGEEFEQYMFVLKKKELINSYPTSLLGRWTEEKTIRFHFRMIRPGM